MHLRSMQDDEVVGFVAKVRLREGAMSKEQARAGALERLQRASTQHRKHLESVEQLEQDGTFSKEEADAERVRIGNERTAKAAYQPSLQPARSNQSSPRWRPTSGG